MTLLNKRRNYFVDKRLQGIWALMNLIIAGIIVLLIGLEILRSFYAEFGWPLANRPFALPDLIFIIKLIVLAGIGGGFFWLLSAFSAHRIAGPIFKLNQGLEEVSNGNYGLRIQFRKKDFFQDVADTFNEMNKSIEQEFHKKEQLLAQVKEKIKLLPQENTQTQELKALLGIE